MGRGKGNRGRGYGKSGPRKTASEERKKRKASTFDGAKKRKASNNMGKWFPSMTCDSHLEGLVVDGFLPQKEVLPWKMAGYEMISTLEGEDRLIHQQLICRGLR